MLGGEINIMVLKWHLYIPFKIDVKVALKSVYFLIEHLSSNLHCTFVTGCRFYQ